MPAAAVRATAPGSPALALQTSAPPPALEGELRGGDSRPGALPFGRTAGPPGPAAAVRAAAPGSPALALQTSAPTPALEGEHRGGDSRPGALPVAQRQRRRFGLPHPAALPLPSRHRHRPRHWRAGGGGPGCRTRQPGPCPPGIGIDPGTGGRAQGRRQPPRRAAGRAAPAAAVRAAAHGSPALALQTSASTQALEGRRRRFGLPYPAALPLPSKPRSRGALVLLRGSPVMYSTALPGWPPFVHRIGRSPSL